MTEPPLILVVDDNDLIGLLLRTALMARGYRVWVATSRQGALDLVAPVGLAAFNLAVLDVYLDQVQGGYHLYEQWRHACPRLPMVLMSGAPDAPTLPAVARGDVPLIVKPFDLDGVLPLLATFAESRTPHGPQIL